MSEDFILTAFRKMGEDPQAVKLMKYKMTNMAAGYCFVTFMSNELVVDAMKKLNGKPIPGTDPIVSFRLDCARNNAEGPDYSCWVGISMDVDDYLLYKTFASRYCSVRSAQVMRNRLDRQSMEHGFVRFGDEREKNLAIKQMSGFVGLGERPLNVREAVRQSEMYPCLKGWLEFLKTEPDAN